MKRKHCELNKEANKTYSYSLPGSSVRTQCVVNISFLLRDYVQQKKSAICDLFRSYRSFFCALLFHCRYQRDRLVFAPFVSVLNFASPSLSFSFTFILFNVIFCLLTTQLWAFLCTYFLQRFLSCCSFFFHFAPLSVSFPEMLVVVHTKISRKLAVTKYDALTMKRSSRTFADEK